MLSLRLLDSELIKLKISDKQAAKALEFLFWDGWQFQLFAIINVSVTE